ncbi:MAG: flagellar protein FliO [Pseudomonadota bacterium]|jgi:flagellar protein FliO/FliZ
MTSWTGPLAAFTLIVLAIPASLWLLRRSGLAGGSAAAAGLRQVASLALAPNQRIVTLEVGQGAQRRWLVLGVTPGGISRLHEMDPQDAAAAGTPSQAATPPGFAGVLARLVTPVAAPRAADPHGAGDHGGTGTNTGTAPSPHDGR